MNSDISPTSPRSLHPILNKSVDSDCLYLVDISAFVFRAYYAIHPLSNVAGEPTNAVYGVATMLLRLLEEVQPDFLAVVYDSKEPTHRQQVYQEYKAHRPAPPDELVQQLPRVEQLIEHLGIHSYRLSGLEADDLIASLTREWCEKDPSRHVVIVSNDKDLMQLVNPQVILWDTMHQKVYDEAAVLEKFKVNPNQIRDYLALVGDASDNIPGVPSIGPKTAADLLAQYGSLDCMLAQAADDKISGKRGQILHEHRALARISAELATLRSDLGVDLPEALRPRTPRLMPEGIEFFRKMGFNSLLDRIGQTPGAVKSLDQAPGASSRAETLAQLELRDVDDAATLTSLVRALGGSRRVGIYLHSSTSDPRTARILGLGLAIDHQAYYLNCAEGGLSNGLIALKTFFENPKVGKVGHQLKRLWRLLYDQGILLQGIQFDTAIAAYVLDPNADGRWNALRARYGWGADTPKPETQLAQGEFEYNTHGAEPAHSVSLECAHGAWCNLQVALRQREELEASDMLRVFEDIDMPLIGVLAQLEWTGVSIDLEWFNHLAQGFGRELEAIEVQVQQIVARPINLNSPKQLGQLLFEELKLPTQAKTKTGYSTDAQTLEILSELHPIPKLVLEYREISKLKGTYADPIPLLQDPRSGKIHANFHQTVTATGRLSSSEPNLQNIPYRSPRGLQIRKGFVASPGCVLLSADYSQIELRLLAHMSQDPELCRAFNENEDVHRQTAGEIFSKPQPEINDAERAVAKAINFGLMYGKTAFGLSQELRIPREEAQQRIDRYFVRYRAVKEFLDAQIHFARTHGYALTLAGRRRQLPDLNSRNVAVRTNAERMAMNTPIQGTAADLIKIAMIQLARQLKKEGLESQLIIQVHDEIILDCPQKELKAVQKLLISEMESAMQLRVPLKVQSKYGSSWLDL